MKESEVVSVGYMKVDKLSKLIEYAEREMELRVLSESYRGRNFTDVYYKLGPLRPAGKQGQYYAKITVMGTKKEI